MSQLRYYDDIPIWASRPQNPSPRRSPVAILPGVRSVVCARRQFALPPVLAFGLAEAVVLAAGVFGASALRTPHQGSEETFAFGIFFSDSLYAFSFASLASFSSGVLVGASAS